MPENRYSFIRKASRQDLSRIAEIYVSNCRVNYLPIFGDEKYAFNNLQVLSVIDSHFGKEEVLDRLYVYDDGIVRGFIEVSGNEIEKLFVDTFFQGKGIGAGLLAFASDNLGASFLWALEKNQRAVSFYHRNGFKLTGKRKPEEGTNEYIVELRR